MTRYVHQLAGHETFVFDIALEIIYEVDFYLRITYNYKLDYK